MGQEYGSAIQILTGIYIEVKWSHFTSTYADTNSTVTFVTSSVFLHVIEATAGSPDTILVKASNVFL